MSWLRPLAFWALVPLLPLLWWALWRMRRPAHWIWPSLLLWERVAAQHPELLRAARTERSPWEAWVWSHLAVAALAVAAAGPALPGPARLRAGLVLDHSPSTAAHAREGGTRRQRIDALAARLAALLAPQDRLERLVVTASGDAALRDGALALRARGCDPVVSIADHTLARPWRAPPRWLALVAASPAGANAALLGAGLRQTEGGAWLLVRVAGAGTGIAALACEVRAGERTLLQRRLPAAPVARPHVLLAPLGVSVTAALTVRVRPLGADGQPIADALAADDALVLWPGSAGPAVHVRGGPAALAPPVRAAFEALGVRWVARGEEAELEARIGDGPRG
ncbi:MAG: hypothetical protein D6776_10130, partial [Planctomycetota bacterium]